jgi:predicted membrane-bound spermidine synthase
VPPEKTPRERAEELIGLLVPDWRPTPWQGLWAIRIGIVLGLLVAIGYSYGVTLWDWIKLLIVPAVIAGGGLWFNRQQRERELEIAREQREREQRIANERAQDEALQGYLDGMSQLLTDKERPLHKAQTSDSLSTVARARTLTVLGRLDSGRKRSVLQFLFESGLID